MFLFSSLALAKASLQEAFLEASGKIQDETHRAKALGLLDWFGWIIRWLLGEVNILGGNV